MTYLRLITLYFCVAVIGHIPSPGLAQANSAQISFGTLKQDPDLPVQVTAETLAVDQENGTAIFSGDVIVIQGEMRLAASEVLVVYNKQNSGIDRLKASGGVTLVSGIDAAESEQADYDIKSGTIVMVKNVLLTQGTTALTSDSMTVNLRDGTARMKGRVTTVFQSGDQ